MKRFICLLSFITLFSSLLKAQETYDLEAILTFEPQKNGTWLRAIRDDQNKLEKLVFKIDRDTWTFLITSIKFDYCGCKIFRGHAELTEDNLLMEIEFRDRTLCLCEESQDKPFGVKIFAQTKEQDSQDLTKVETIEYVGRLLPPPAIE